MPETEKYVLSTIHSGSELTHFTNWLSEVRARNIRHGLLEISICHDHLPMALQWLHYFDCICPAHLMHFPFIETRIKGHGCLSSLLIWLSSSRRSIARGATVTRPHFLQYASPSYERICKVFARHIRFTDREAVLWGGHAEYRFAQATRLLTTSSLICPQDLLKEFGGWMHEG